MEIICCNQVIRPQKGKPVVCKHCGTKYDIKAHKKDPEKRSNRKQEFTVTLTLAEILGRGALIIVVLIILWIASLL